MKFEIRKLYLLLKFKDGLPMIGFVFDANVPWDLEKIGKLDEMLKILEDNLNFRIYISELNFNEMPPYYILLIKSMLIILLAQTRRYN